MNASMLTKITDQQALDLVLSEPKPKPGTTTPGQVEAAAYILGDRTTALRLGVWECSPGRFNVERKATEICRIVKGKATLRASDGSVYSPGIGETFVVPKGWKGEWVIEDVVRKIFIVDA